MKLLAGKKGLIIGLANDKSIAWGISQKCHEHSAELGFTFLNEALEKRVRPLAESLGADFIVKCDAEKNEDIVRLFDEVEKKFGKLDFVVHSIAHASAEDLKNRFHLTTREGFQHALEVSAYSLIKIVASAKRIINPGGSIMAMTYYGAEKVVPNYRIMGVAKAALEASVRELAADLGPDGIRVNAISAGPIRTLAASGVSDFKSLMTGFEGRAPLRRLVTQEDIGNAAVYLLSDMSRSVTGEIHYVDGGFNITAA
jgi:enoyl-[acyl-carrier protein] reductase I